MYAPLAGVRLVPSPPLVRLAMASRRCGSGGRSAPAPGCRAFPRSPCPSRRGRRSSLCARVEPCALRAPLRSAAVLCPLWSPLPLPGRGSARCGASSLALPWAAPGLRVGGRRFPLARLAALGSPPPLPSGGFGARPCGRALCGALRPPREKGFLSPLRRRHGGFLIPLYAAQQVEAPCVADTVIKDRSDYASPHGHFKQNMIYFV